MEKFNWKHKLILSACTAVAYGILLYLMYYATLEENDPQFNFWSVAIQSIFFGLSMGFLFPWGLQKLAPKLEKQVKTPELEGDEHIIMEGPANLFRNKWIAVGGKLFLTNKRLIFNSHKYNLQNCETSIPLEEIARFSERKTSGIVDNGLRVKTSKNEKFDFVVSQREEWIRNLNGVKLL